MINRAIVFGTLFYIIQRQNPVMAQVPTRDPHTPGYVSATELPDGTNPSPNLNGNFIIGATHNPAPESMVQANVPQGTYTALPSIRRIAKFTRALPGIPIRLARQIRQTRPN